MKKMKAIFMRGGTTNGIMLHWEEMPEDRGEWNDLLLRMTGSMDAKGVDGLRTAKVLIIRKSERPDIDVEYIVGHVLPERGTVDWGANCGNMTTAVGPYAVIEKMVEITEPYTEVALLNVNTDKRIVEHVSIDPATKSFPEYGMLKDAGIKFPGGEVVIDFTYPAGSSTGCLLPTGNCIDEYDVPGIGRIEATLIDATNPTVLFRAEDFGLTGYETPSEISGNADLSEKLETARCMVSVKAGISKDMEDARLNHPAEPRIGVFSAPKDCKTIDGDELKASEMDVNIRLMTMGMCHRALAISSAVALAVHGCLKGGIVEKELGPMDPTKGIRLGCPAGVITLTPEYEYVDGQMDLKNVGIRRSARKIMEGTFYIPE